MEQVALAQSARANLLLIGTLGASRLTEFSEFACNKGYNVHVAEPEYAVEQELSQTINGIVLFLDTTQSCDYYSSPALKYIRYLDIPLVAVSSRTGGETFTRLTAAGATLLPDAERSNDLILSEVARRCNTIPIVSEIRENLLVPFVESIISSMEAMTSTTPVARSSYQKDGYKMFGDVSAVIGLVASAEGSMVLSFPEATAIDLAKRILAGIDDNPSNDMILDCVGEFANVVAGQAKGVLAGTPYHFDLATPTIISGCGHEIRHKPGMPCLVTAFGSPIGDFALQLCMSARESLAGEAE